MELIFSPSCYFKRGRFFSIPHPSDKYPFRYDNNNPPRNDIWKENSNWKFNINNVTSETSFSIKIKTFHIDYFLEKFSLEKSTRRKIVSARNSHEERCRGKSEVKQTYPGWGTIIIISFHSDEFSPLIRESIEPSPAILITHGHRVTPPPPVSPLGHKTLYNFANKKVSTIQPRLSGEEGVFESISGCSRLDRASPIEAFRSDEGRILRILRHEIHVVIGQVSAKGAGTLWRGETWRRNGRSWLRYAEFPIFTPSSFLERVLHVRKDFDEPDGFLSSPPSSYSKSRFTFFLEKK